MTKDNNHLLINKSNVMSRKGKNNNKQSELKLQNLSYLIWYYKIRNTVNWKIMINRIMIEVDETKDKSKHNRSSTVPSNNEGIQCKKLHKIKEDEKKR